MTPAFKRLLLVIALILLYFLGLGMRRAVLEAQYAALGSEIPYTLESALFYRRIQQIQQLGTLPSVDSSVQYPDGVVVRETYSIGSEYLLANRRPFGLKNLSHFAFTTGDPPGDSHRNRFATRLHSLAWIAHQTLAASAHQRVAKLSGPVIGVD